MLRLLSVVFLFSALAGGCASSMKVERAADRLDQRAAEADARGDHYTAERYRLDADKQREKAAKRAYYESYYGNF